jgi:hypothetical protein
MSLNNSCTVAAFNQVCMDACMRFTVYKNCQKHTNYHKTITTQTQRQQGIVTKAFLGYGSVNTFQRETVKDVSQWTNVIACCPGNSQCVNKLAG